MSSKTINEFGLTERVMGEICDIFAGHARVKKVLVYGSRAMGRYHSGSDIDLTMFGDDLTLSDALRISRELEESSIPFMADLSIYDRLDNAKLKDHINRVGKVFYDRFAGWEMVKLGDVSKVSAGNSAPQEGRFFINGMYPFCRTADVGRIKVGKISECKDRLNEEGVKKLRLFKKGTVLFPKSGASTFLNHRVILGMDSYVSSHLSTIKGYNEKALDEFLFYFLQTISAKQLVSDSGYPSLKTATIANIIVSLPPLKQQRRIVAKLDAAFSEIDAAIAAAEQKVVQIENLKAAILSDALIPQSGGWETAKLGDLCDIKMGKTPPRAGLQYWDKEKTSGNVWLSIADLTALSGRYIADSKEYVSDKGAALCRTVPKDTLIMSFKLSIGKLAFTAKELITNEAIAAFIIENESLLQKDYLYYILLSYEWDKISGQDVKVKGKTLNKAKLRNISVSYPQIEQQQAIVAKLDTAFTEIESASRATRRKLSELKALKTAVLRQELGYNPES